MADRVDLAPMDLRALLRGATPPAAGDLYCEGLLVATAAGGALTAIACPHPQHGVHPRFAAAAAALRPGAPATIPCPRCGGTGLLPIDQPHTVTTIALALAVGFFRGIPLPPEGQQP